MRVEVMYVFRGGRRDTVYAGRDGRQAYHAFDHWAVSGALRAELLKEGELWDCRGLNASHPLLERAPECSMSGG